MPEDARKQFGEALLLHLNAAYNLARWLTRDAHAAEDVVQDACCRALKYYHGFRGSNSRSWLLRIVHRAAYDWMSKNRYLQEAAPFDEIQHSHVHEKDLPEFQAGRLADAELIHDAISRLPDVFREVTILRDLEGLSYREIAEVIEAPLGTVMSRLARARRQLQEMLSRQLNQEF